MVGEAFYAIAERRRRDILLLIQNKELSSGEIAARFEVTRPAISQHLRVLSEAGLVTMRRQGTRRLYKARPEGLAEIKEFLEGFWDTSLQLLKQAAENEERGLDSHGHAHE
jgi:DNA-binding transcriptional ArsR family regulator